MAVEEIEMRETDFGRPEIDDLPTQTRAEYQDRLCGRSNSPANYNCAAAGSTETNYSPASSKSRAGVRRPTNRKHGRHHRSTLAVIVAAAL